MVAMPVTVVSLRSALALALLVFSASLLGGSAVAADPRIAPVAPLPAEEPPPTIERLGLESTRCFGTCPAFSVVFAADGSFRYVGEAHVDRLGEHSGRVGLGKLEMVMHYVDEIGFVRFDSVYPARFLDFPTSYLMVDYAPNSPAMADGAAVGVSDDGVKIVENQGYQAPAVIWALEVLLLDLLEGAYWDE